MALESTLKIELLVWVTQYEPEKIVQDMKNGAKGDSI